MKCKFLDRLLLFYMTVKDVLVYFVKTGDVIDRSELSQMRMLKCEYCCHCSLESRTCGICGCYMKIKTRLIASKCPIGKW